MSQPTIDEYGTLVGGTFIKTGNVMPVRAPYDNVIRWIPPLVIEEVQIHDALTVFRAALEQL